MINNINKGDHNMSRSEVKQRVSDLFGRGYSIESEIHYIDKIDGIEKKSRILSRPSGDYKYKVIYTRNNKGVFTASDVQLFDAYTDLTRDSHNRVDIAW